MPYTIMNLTVPRRPAERALPGQQSLWDESAPSTSWSMSTLALTGRILFALYFITQGVFKYPGPCPQSFSGCNDAFLMMLPWIEEGLSSLGLTPSLEPGHFVMAVGSLELIGGILFVANSSVGAVMLLGSLLISTPVMHAFFLDEPDSPRQMANIIHAQKNLALVGALLLWIETRVKRKSAS